MESHFDFDLRLLQIYASLNESSPCPSVSNINNSLPSLPFGLLFQGQISGQHTFWQLPWSHCHYSGLHLLETWTSTFPQVLPQGQFQQAKEINTGIFFRLLVGGIPTSWYPIAFIIWMSVFPVSTVRQQRLDLLVICQMLSHLRHASRRGTILVAGAKGSDFYQ